MKIMKKQDEKIVYYNSYDCDIIKNKKQDIKINKNFKWIHTNLLYKICSCITFRIACIFSFFYAKFAMHMKVINKEILKEYKNSGYFIYGNHTQPIGDAFNPTCVVGKRFYTIANQSNLGVPVIGRILPMLGALIIPDNISDTKRFISAVKTRINEKNAIVIYPEAHVWPYYTKIRPFDVTSFDFPIQMNTASFCMTTTYYKRKNKEKPGINIYIDGPFFPDNDLPPKARKDKLCKEIQDTMIKRSKNSSYEYIQYIERKK